MEDGDVPKQVGTLARIDHIRGSKQLSKYLAVAE